jgi:hypothetical protein
MNAADTSPAGGAEIVEVVIATGGALLATVALLALGFAHRTGRTQLLRRLAEFAARDSGLKPWAALPSVIAAGSLLVALLGMYWDISLHIGDGRDAGPLANPAHYLILFGLYGIFAAGFLAIVLPDGRPSRGAVRIAGEWYAPLGGIAMIASSAFALIGFPLDDVWHRIFGQDVTLWGPTHLMLIGGAGLTLIGSAILLVEGHDRVANPRNWRAVLARGRRAFAFGGLLIGLSTFQAEFDFGVPQFNLVLEPVMLAFAAGVALVGARIWIGRGGALAATLFFVAVRGIIALIVGPGLGETTPHLPLYLAEALVVELAALVIATRRPYAFAALAGALIGTVGFAAEYAWSHVWMPVAWPETLIADALPATIVAALGASLIGAFLATALAGSENASRGRAGSGRPKVVPAAIGLAAIAAVVALNVFDAPDSGLRGEVRLSEVTPSPERMVDATVRISPPEATEDANWVSAIAWQGGGLVLNDLEQVRAGVYRTTEPLPVHGTWKTLIRLHRGDSLVGLPLYMPEDRAIPADAVPAKPRFEREFVDETLILQRELKGDVPGYLAAIAYTLVGAIVLAIILLLGWVLTRLGSQGGVPDERSPRRAGEAPIRRREATA